jgi:hypothetical protein
MSLFLVSGTTTTPTASTSPSNCVIRSFSSCRRSIPMQIVVQLAADERLVDLDNAAALAEQ